MGNLVVNTPLTVTDEFDARAEELRRILAKYIPEFAQVYKGWRSPGASDLQFPCAMVEMRPSQETMESAGTFTLKLTFDIYFYVLDNDPDGLAVRQSNIFACLTKLFSNNGIVEYINTNPTDPDAPATNKFKENPGFWYNLEIGAITPSTLYKWTGSPNQEYARAGRMTLTLWDQVQK